MRDIKFRAYINYGYTEKELNDPDMFEELQTTGLGFMDIPDLIDFENERIKYDSDWYDKDRFKLMQYTGLKDKNGKEIYEGDIFATDNNHNFTVIYEDTRFIGVDGDRDGKGYVCCVDSCYKDGSSSIEVIGNIYENPELLERSCQDE